MGRLIASAKFSHEEYSLHAARESRQPGLFYERTPGSLENIDDWRKAAKRSVEIDPDGSISRALLRQMDRYHIQRKD